MIQAPRQLLVLLLQAVGPGQVYRTPEQAEPQQKDHGTEGDPDDRCQLQSGLGKLDDLGRTRSLRDDHNGPAPFGHSVPASARGATEAPGK